jgi:hypothetical protein
MTKRHPPRLLPLLGCLSACFTPVGLVRVTCSILVHRHSALVIAITLFWVVIAVSELVTACQ